MIKYMVFDWDGTLADTYPIINAAYTYTFEKMGLPVMSVEKIKEVTSSKQNKDIFAYIFGARSQEAKDAYYEYIEQNHCALRAMPYAKELLDFCLLNNIHPLLMTNKKTKYIHEEIKVLGFEKYFSKIVAAGECVQDKPHQIACEALFGGHVPPQDEIMVIGDGKADVEVARNYNVPVIIYDPKNTQKIQGNYNVRDFREVIEILKNNINNC